VVVERHGGDSESREHIVPTRGGARREREDTNATESIEWIE